MNNGPLRFDEFMSQALYGPNGFYTGGGQAGRRGDFLTSPEVGPLFGAVVARACDAWWEQLGCPDDFRIIDAGAGPGTLARSILAASPRCLGASPGRYLAVETSEPQRAQHPEGVTSLTSLGEVPDGAVAIVIANELLDNLPFRLAVYDGFWQEAYVERSDEHWTERLSPFPTTPAVLPAKAPHGARAPIQEVAADWVGEALRKLSSGRVVAIDYASAVTATLCLSPWREWLRTYRGHERGSHYLDAPGSQDITTQVCVDQLIAAVGPPDAVRSQAQFLGLWGIDELVDEGRRIWNEQAARPGLEAMRARSRIREAEALLDPHGLGGFTVMEWVVSTQ